MTYLLKIASVSVSVPKNNLYQDCQRRLSYRDNDTPIQSIVRALKASQAMSMAT